MSTSPHENDASPRRVEPLRDLGQVEALRTASWNTPEIRLRTGIVDRLMVAQSLVPRALRFLIIAGHRPPQVSSPCPHATDHTTGGAVDLTAHVDGSPEPAPWSAMPPPQWRAVTDALHSVGMVNGYRWWHWSFGDARWCEHIGGSEPLYDAIS
jgi:zinc D-Ala-D-Ala dipeptidase